MIITLFFVALIISGIAVYIYEEREYGDGLFNLYTCSSCMIGTIGLLTCIIVIIIAHTGVDNNIEINRIRRESIEQRYDALQSQCEDISDISVLQDIADWNIDVTNTRYWSNHPMTSWFYSKREVQSLELIDK